MRSISLFVSEVNYPMFGFKTGRGFDSRSGHTQDLKNGISSLPSLVLGVNGWV